MLNSVQYARALAAFAVVIAHLPGFAWFAPLGMPSVGGFGVDMFFVISGYIMWMTAADTAPGTFAWRRLVRIVPAYWLYTGLLVALSLLAPALTPNVELSAEALLGSLFFIPYRNHNEVTAPLVLQGWTLNFEMFFYVIFGLALAFAPRRIRFIVIVGGLAALSILGVLLRSTDPIIDTYTSQMLIEFALGMLLAAHGPRFRAPYAVFLVIGLLAFAALMVFDFLFAQVWPRGLLAGVPALLLVWSLLGLEDWLKRRPNGLVLSIGDASYSLYLSHSFVLAGVSAGLSFVNRHVIPVEGIFGAIVFGIIAVIASLIWAHLSYQLIERPSMLFLNRWREDYGAKRTSTPTL